MNILAKFLKKKTIFDEILVHLLILLFYKALTTASEGHLRWSRGDIFTKFRHTFT